MWKIFMITYILVKLSAVDALGVHYGEFEASADGKLVLISPDTASMFISLRMRSAWLIYLVLHSAGKWNLFGLWGIVLNKHIIMAALIFPRIKKIFVSAMKVTNTCSKVTGNETENKQDWYTESECFSTSESFDRPWVNLTSLLTHAEIVIHVSLSNHKVCCPSRRAYLQMPA